MSSALFRIDTVTFGKPVRTADGFLKVPARVSQVGILEYPKEDGGVFRELVDEETLFNADSMKTLSLLPVTDEHPKKKVDSANARRTMRGVTGETARKEGADGLGTDIVLMDDELIESAERGDKREVSAGYTTELLHQSGVWNGQRYDAIQRNRVYNHIAVVPSGRAGKQVRLKMDSAHQLNQEDGNMATLKLDGKEYEVEQKVADALKAAKLDASEKSDALDTAKAAHTKAIDTLQAKLDASEAEAKKLKKEEDKEEGKKKFDAAVTAKLALIEVAKTHVKADAVPELMKLDAEGIMKACILAHEPKLNLDGKSADYIQARFDALPAEKEEKEDAEDDLGKELAKGRKDAGEPKTPAQARQAHNDSLKNRWRTPLGETAKAAA